MPSLNRREFLAGAVGAASATALAGLTVPDAAEAAPASGGRQLAVRQGTNIAPRLSPDGRTVAFDLLGVLWLVPVAGGAARRLTGDLFDIAQPDWSPDGSTLAFQSYRDGNYHIWTVRTDGSDLRQLTTGRFDHREPRWSPDGTKIALSTDASGSYGIQVLDVATRALTVLVDSSAEEFEATWSPDGKRVAFVVAGSRIDVVEVATGARKTAVTAPAGQVIHAPEWTPAGDDLVYTLFSGAVAGGSVGATELVLAGKPLFSGEDVYPFRVSWFANGDYLYAADGTLRRRSRSGGAPTAIAFTALVDVARPDYRKRRRDFDSQKANQVVGIGSPVLSPDGRQVAFRALNDIYLMPVGGHPAPLTRDHWWKSHPAFSPDGRQLSYSTDRGGKLDIWIRDLAAGTDRQLTHLPDAAAVSGSWSRDGRTIAFLDQTGALHTVDVASGAVRKVFTATFEPGRPTWSPDGSVIALAAIKPNSARFREGLSEILLVNVKTGAATYVEPLPGRSLQTRGDDGPVWSPDGSKLAFVVGSVLYVVDVHTDGTYAGTPRQVTDEVTDAPSWHGDSRHLLYLNNGRLRLVSLDGGQPRTVPVGLSWTNTTSRGRTVIRAGRMWDGVSDRLRSNVDIVVEGHRIVSVGSGRHWDGQIVDARDSVVIPGLVDMHNHREMQGYGYGDRQGRLWLSLGITTTRSPGSPAYHMVEERESIQSGVRVGPRYFATGEAIDGSRIFYNFMRPTVDSAQLALELERAKALDYDLMKAYVRLSPERQRKVIEFAHANNILATSHYHYPALAFGGDGMEHVGATNRLGYSRTVSALGSGMSDVTDLFDATKAARTPTLFVSAAMFGTDQSLYHDDRVRTLYPSWEYASLKAAVDAAQANDPTATLHNLAKQVRQLATMIRGGGIVVTGTDSPIDHTAVSTHMNLRAMVAYGLTPYEALTTATRNPGLVLGEPLGQLAPGSYADLAVLGGDPLTDIKQAANVRQVMANGRLFTVAELLAPFTATQPAIAHNEMLPAVASHPSNDQYWWHDPHYVLHSRTACCQG
ncbi:amidohydrolase family protein [Fodinicola acaciae]|uniref:amidohydrolase family protein n=1 Tax=Fodinicola acaciae TaxID=2681555 RepID=UPI001C9E3FF0|nr:amidohydrolase family protein [Fodinicola acaciae]